MALVLRLALAVGPAAQKHRPNCRSSIIRLAPGTGHTANKGGRIVNNWFDKKTPKPLQSRALASLAGCQQKSGLIFFLLEYRAAMVAATVFLYFFS